MVGKANPISSPEGPRHNAGLLLFRQGSAQPSGESAAAGAEVRAEAAAAAAAAQSNRVHWGCRSYFPSGGCRDIYPDSQGNYWRCYACGTTGTPSTSECTRISSRTLATGYWCS